MKSTLTLFLFFAFAHLNAQVKHIGSMSEMEQNGFKATIKLDSLLQRQHLFGLGPYGKMQGEITVINGQPFVGYGDENGNLKIKKDYTAESPFFVYAYVSGWKTFEINAEITDVASVQMVIEKMAREQGYTLTEPFPFRIKADIDEINIHAVAPRSPEISGYKEGIKSYKYDFTNIHGEIFGIYSQHGQGMYTAQNSYVHLHFISSDSSKMGHINGLNISSKHKLQVLLPEQLPMVSNLNFKTIDTDFSKGRLNHRQMVTLNDLEKFHGHLCDGLVVGALAMQEAMQELYPNQPIDRTNLRIVSKPSPCLTDVAVYLTGGRYQFNTFYVDSEFEGIYIIQRIDNLKTVSVSLNNGVKPTEIDSLGNIAVQQNLSPCDIDHLKKLEDDFTQFLLQSNAEEIITVKSISNFNWQPVIRNDYLKTDILNKNLKQCND